MELKLEFDRKLRPLPGCVILRFDRAITEKPIETVDGKTVSIYTSTASYQVRIEIGELVAAGAATNYEESTKRAELIERARQGERFPVRWLAGQCFGDNLPTGSELEWLKDYRVYKYSELTASIPMIPDHPSNEGKL